VLDIKTEISAAHPSFVCLTSVVYYLQNFAVIKGEGKGHHMHLHGILGNNIYSTSNVVPVHTMKPY